MNPDTSPSAATSSSPATEAAWTVVCAVAAFVVYLATLCPTVYVMDSPELVAVADTWGVAHPPGYPLFTLLYGALVHAVPIGDVALRANVITALLAAAGVGVLFRAGRAAGVGHLAAAAGALGVAFARDWWVQATATEVYALDGLLAAIAVLAAVRVVRRPDHLRGWLALGIACGLAAGHRAPNALYLAPLVLWGLLAARAAGTGLRGPLLRVIGGGLATLLVFVYLPIAASTDPAMNMGDPSDLERFWIVLSAGPYARHLGSTTLELSLGRLVTMFWRLPVQAPLLVAAAAFGAYRGHTDGGEIRRRAHALATVVLLNVGFVALYNVPDIEGFLQPAFCAAAVLAALGVARVVKDASRRALLGGLAVAGAVLPIAWTWTEADLSGVTTVEEYGRDLLDSAQPGSIVLTFDDTARNAMVFQQVVRGYRTDVAIVDPTAALDWHLEETRVRAPGFDTLGVGGTGWSSALARRLLRERDRGVYVTDIEGIDWAFLVGPDAAARATTVPAGLLFRVIVPPPGMDPTALRNDLAAEWSEAFWTERAMPEIRTSRSDPQLGYIPARYARPRLILAVSHVMSGRLDAAEPHLVAIGTSDVDAYEDAVIANLRTIGVDPPDWNAASRARRGLTAARTGGAVRDVILALAPE